MTLTARHFVHRFVALGGLLARSVRSKTLRGSILRSQILDQVRQEPSHWHRAIVVDVARNSSMARILTSS
jgi:hypothetical protein